MSVIYKALTPALRKAFSVEGKEDKGTVDHGIKRNEVKAMIDAHTEFCSVAKGIIYFY